MESNNGYDTGESAYQWFTVPTGTDHELGLRGLSLILLKLALVILLLVSSVVVFLTLL